MYRNLRLTTNILLSIIAVVFYIFIFSFISEAKYITVEEYNCTSSKFNFNATLRNSILSKGILQQSIQLIPYKLEKEKMLALESFFNENPLRYVLSYKEREIKYNHESILAVDILSDMDALKNSLINLGIYFKKSKIKCKLEVENFDKQDFVNLSNLLLLTGVLKIDNINELQLNIKKIKNSLYTGSLKYNNYIWVGTSKSIYKLWEILWKNYFNLPSIKDKFFSKIIIYAGPWITTSGLKYFNDQIKERKEIIDKIELIKIEFNEGIFGKWKIISIRPSEVMSYLNKYFGERDMKVKIRLISPKEKNQDYNSGTQN